MRYLALPELEQLNSLLSNIDSDDGSRITGRLEAYSCKAAGADKKLWRLLEGRFHATSAQQPTEARDDFELMLSSSPPAGPTESQTGMTLKLFYYLIATMNLVFPDYDFSDLPPSVFILQPSLNHVMNHVNTTLFNTGVNKNLASFDEFSSRMWERVDLAIGLAETEIYSFVSADFDALEDPFWERGCIWSFNYFFWNRKLKRIMLFTCRAVSSISRDFELFATDERLGQQRSSTPLTPVL